MPKTEKPKFDLYQVITDQVVAMLEKGVAPWKSPILGARSAGWPRNLVSGKQYRGVNVFLLSFTAFAKGYESSYWATYKQITDKGGNVKKGERATMVVFWTKLEIDKKTASGKATGEKKNIPLMRYYNVFNVEAQCEGIEVPDRVTYTPTDFSPIDEAAAIVAGYEDGPEIKHEGKRACYNTAEDVVKLPEPKRFTSAEAYYATLFHELAHSTGHATRLNRDMSGTFGGELYGKEELIAEMAAAFLGGHCNLTPVTLPNQAAYLQGWIKTLKADKKLVVTAAGAAQKAADRILGTTFDEAGSTPAYAMAES